MCAILKPTIIIVIRIVNVIVMVFNIVLIVKNEYNLALVLRIIVVLIIALIEPLIYI